MESKEKNSNSTLKKSQDRLIKALDIVESVFERKIDSMKQSHDQIVDKLKERVEELELQNRDLTFALEKVTNNHDHTKNITSGVVQELDDTIESLERILKVHHADN
jgi:hypothetical protein